MRRLSEDAVPKYRSLTQIIVDSLRQRIFDAEYTPGMRLNITELAQDFGASPVPVREALRNLESEGLIEFRLNRGVVVRHLSHEVIRELYLIRSPLECLAGAEAARQATQDDINDLETLVARLDKNLGAESWHQFHRTFHERICAISHLPRLIQLCESLRGQMRPYSKAYLSNRDHILQAQEEHRQMVACIRDHDADRIVTVIREHIERPARMAMAAFDGNGDVPPEEAKKPRRQKSK